VEILSPQHIKVTVWERGAGATLACGSGACASLAVAERLGLARSPCKVELPGGTLTIEKKEDARIYMTGPAAFVFTGDLED